VEGHEAEPRDARELAVWREALGRVLAGRDLEIVTQPIVDLRTGAVFGYEALTRFAGAPAAGPDVWFELADEFGVSPELMAVTLRRQLALVEHLPKGRLLAVKVSCLGLDADAVQPILQQAALDGVVVELDRPERFGDGDDPGDLVDLAELVEQLRSRGARIAVTSTAGADVPAIDALRPDIVRLDRAVIGDIDRDGGKRALVDAAHAVLDSRGIRLLAHGIELPAELETLIGLGVPLGQGYLLGDPAPGWARAAPPRGTG